MHCSDLIRIFLGRLHGHGKCTIAEAIQDAQARGVLVSHSTGEEYDDGSYGQWFEMVVIMLDECGVITADDCPILQTWKAGEYLPDSEEYDPDSASKRRKSRPSMPSNGGWSMPPRPATNCPPNFRVLSGGITSRRSRRAR